MKQIIIKYGIISGITMAALMFATALWFDKAGYIYAGVIGYASMVTGFLPVFFGVRKFRDTLCEGYIGFGKAASVSIAAGLFANLFYVAAWLIIYYNFPGVVEKINNYSLQQMKDSGISPKDMAAMLKQMQQMKEMYKNPLINAAATYAKPLFGTLIFSALTALLIRKKPPTLPLN